MTIEKYVLVDGADVALDGYYDSFQKARSEAVAKGCAVVAHIWEWSDSELVWTPDGGDTWPPEMV